MDPNNGTDFLTVLAEILPVLASAFASLVSAMATVFSNLFGGLFQAGALALFV